MALIKPDQLLAIHQRGKFGLAEDVEVRAERTLASSAIVHLRTFHAPFSSRTTARLPIR